MNLVQIPVNNFRITKVHGFLVLKLGLAALCVWIAATLVPKAQWYSLLDHPGGFLCLVVGWMVNQVLCACRLWVILRSVGYNTEFGSIVRIVFSSFLFGSLFPGIIVQDLAKIALIRTTSVAASATGLPQVVLVILADRILGLFSLWLLAFILSFVVTLPAGLTADLIVYSIRFGGILVLGALIFAVSTKLLTRAIRRRPVGGKLGELIALLDMFFSRRTFRAALLFALPVSLLAGGSLMILQAEIGGRLMLAAGQPVAVILQAFLAPASLVISALPLAPAGIGFGQLGLAAIYEIAGLPAAVGVLLATIMQMSQLAAACLLGLPALLSLRSANRMRRGEASGSK
jgi:uncharacterized membrane protein YbhN (UPF0104 family)